MYIYIYIYISISIDIDIYIYTIYNIYDIYVICSCRVTYQQLSKGYQNNQIDITKKN